MKYMLNTTALLTALCFFSAAQAGTILPKVEMILSSTERSQDENTLNLVITNKSDKKVIGRATYTKKQLPKGMHLLDDIKPYVEFTVPAQSEKTIFCLPKDKKGRLTTLKEITINKKNYLKAESLASVTDLEVVISK